MFLALWMNNERRLRSTIATTRFGESSIGLYVTGEENVLAENVDPVQRPAQASTSLYLASSWARPSEAAYGCTEGIVLYILILSKMTVSSLLSQSGGGEASV